MHSSKEQTQRRMLNNRATVTSPKFAKLAARSPANKTDLRKIQARTTVGSSQSFKDSDTARSSNKLPKLIEPIPHRVTENLQHGEIQFDNKDRYEGGMKNGKMYGKGTYYFYQQNLKYTGEFFDNLFHGWGVIRKNYGSQAPIYEGNFEYGKKHGQGKYEYGNNHYYNGNWAFDKKQGKGIYHYGEGLYNGGWEENAKHGEGTLKLNDGTEFKGQFENDKFVKGLIKYPNGDEYSGAVVDGKREGEGSYFSLQSQERYKGQWRNNQKHGRGTVYTENGDELHCSFREGRIDETQSCTYKWNSGSEEGSIFNGWFKNGRPEKGHVTRSNGQEFDTY